jgi:putative redox protein
MATHQVSLLWKGNMMFDTEVNGHTIRLDANTDDGGANTGPRPKPLMLDAFAGCTAMDVISLLDKMKVNYAGLQIDVSGELTDEHPKIYHKVHVIYMINANEEEDDKIRKAVALSQDKYCGVSAMFRAFAEVSWEIKYVK